MNGRCLRHATDGNLLRQHFKASVVSHLDGFTQSGDHPAVRGATWLTLEGVGPTAEARDHANFLLIVLITLNVLKDMGASGSTDRKSRQENAKEKK